MDNAGKSSTESAVQGRTRVQLARLTGPNARHVRDTVGQVEGASAATVRAGYSSAGERRDDQERH